MERPPLYSFVGPEGSGKSTQAKILAEQLGLPYVSTGDMIRHAAKHDKTKFGDACREMFAGVGYLKAELLLEMLGKRFQKPDIKNGVVLDGGFRTLKETENFESFMGKVGLEFDINVISLRVATWRGVARILSDDRGRDDDTREKTIKRLLRYSENLGLRMSFARRNWNFTIIMANNKSEEEVNRAVKDWLATQESALPS